jgi:hypothetical protein
MFATSSTQRNSCHAIPNPFIIILQKVQNKENLTIVSQSNMKLSSRLRGFSESSSRTVKGGVVVITPSGATPQHFHYCLPSNSTAPPESLKSSLFRKLESSWVSEDIFHPSSTHSHADASETHYDSEKSVHKHISQESIY